MPAARHRVRLLAVALIAVAAVAVAGGGPAAADRTAADARRDDRALAGREQAALSQLYATETALARAQAATAAASARVDRLSREADALRGEVREARRGLGSARRNLAERLTAIYKADRIDPIAVLVTSASLQQALDTADALKRVAQGDETVVEQMTTARDRLAGSLARLRRTQAAAESERRALADGEAALAASHAAKQSLLGALRRQRHGLGREIAHLDTLARGRAALSTARAVGHGQRAGRRPLADPVRSQPAAELRRRPVGDARRRHRRLRAARRHRLGPAGRPRRLRGRPERDPDGDPLPRARLRRLHRGRRGHGHHRQHHRPLDADAQAMQWGRRPSPSRSSEVARARSRPAPTCPSRIVQRVRRRLLLVAVLVAVALAAVPNALAAGSRILPILRSTGLAGAGTGVSVIDVDTGAVVFNRNASRLLIPASNEKLFTGVAALNKLGPGFRFATVVAGLGSRAGSTWRGNLYLIGSGDPSFGTAQVASLAHQLRAMGIRRVTGRVIGDESIYDGKRYGPLWKAAYIGIESPPLSGLSYNRNTGPTGRVVAEPARAAARALRVQLGHIGVKVGARLVATGRAPAQAEAIVAVQSPPLWKLTRFMAQESDNFTAEMLTKAIGAYAGSGGSTSAGIAVARTLVTGLSAAPRRACGRSTARGSRVRTARPRTPSHACSWRRSTTRASVRRSTPRWPWRAVNGTLQRRLTRGPGLRRVHGKTGTLNGVSSLSGYVTARGGKHYAFSILMNATGSSFWRAHEAQDRIAASLAAGR